MATTLTDTRHLTYVSIPIAKWEEDKDGNLVVYGKATDGSVDSDQQIVDSDWSAKALQDWMASGPNLRVQHNPQRDPAGNGISVEINRDGDGAHWVKSLVVEPVAKTLVRSGALRAYSVGIARPVIKRDPRGVAKGGIITDGELAEISLVDRPANRNCGITLVKSVTGDATKADEGWTFGDLDGLLAQVIAKGKDGMGARDMADQDGAGSDDEDDASGDDADTGGPEDADLNYDDDEADDEDDEPAAGKPGEAKPDLTKKNADPVRAAYDAERAAWLAREPRPHLGDVAPTSGTALLVKMAAADQWEQWDAEGERAGLDGTPTGYQRWLGKRQFDPAVGGGVDRDEIPDQDHVDPQGRRFPIHTPGDVSDAVSSYGRADPPIPMKRFRKRLTAIARRKGAEFEAELPESWHTDEAAAKARTPGKGSVPQDLFDFTDDDSTIAGPVAPAADKGVKDCPRCGAPHHADAKIRRCEKCGKKLPKMPETDMGKGRRMVPADVEPAGEHREPDGTTSIEQLEPDAGMHVDPDSVPDRVPASVDAAGTTKPRNKGKGGKGKPFPGAAPPFGGGRDAMDPDDDGDDDTDGPDTDNDDDDVTMGKGYTLRRMHDALCAAYDWSHIAAAYPAVKTVTDAIDPDWYIDRARLAAAKGEAMELADLGVLLAEAEALTKGTVEPAALADARAELHKGFADMYPQVTVSPTDMSPGRFQRPYLSAGHAALNASAPRVAALPPPSHTPHPDDFHRPLITAGHQAEPPGNRGDNLPTPSVATGSSRTYYTTAARSAARSAMQAMHDHIASTFPDMCPMATSKAVLPADMGATNRPTPTSAMDVAAAPGERATKTAKVKKAKVAGAGMVTKGDLAAIVKAAVAEATTTLTTTYETQLAALRAEVDELGSQPDPAQAPLRGAVKRATDDDTTAPVERVSLVEQAQLTKAAQEREEQARFIRDNFLHHPDPLMRERAEASIRRLYATDDD